MLRFLIPALLFSAAFAGDEPAAVISLQPLGPVKADRIAVVKAGLEQAFGLTVEMMKVEPLPKTAWYRPRGRYRAEKLLDHLGRAPNAERPVVVGITEKDISTTKGEHKDWGIFGLGELDGRTCVVSTFRLNARGADEEKLRERLRKIAIHEVGHVMGLPHCPAVGCIMQDAEASIDTVDRESGAFCKNCSAITREWIERKRK